MLKLQIIARAEMALARIRARRAATQTVFILIALVFALCALGMLNFAGYQALTVRYGSAIAAMLMGLTDGLLAVVLIVISGQVGGQQAEEKMAQEISDLARAELKTDFDEVRDEVAQVGETVGRIRDGFSIFSSAKSNSLRTMLRFVTRVLRRSRKK